MSGDFHSNLIVDFLVSAANENLIGKKYLNQVLKALLHRRRHRWKNGVRLAKILCPLKENSLTTMTLSRMFGQKIHKNGNNYNQEQYCQWDYRTRRQLLASPLSWTIFIEVPWWPTSTAY